LLGLAPQSSTQPVGGAGLSQLFAAISSEVTQALAG